MTVPKISTPGPPTGLTIVEAARARRAELQRIGNQRSTSLAVSVLFVWVVAVLATGQLDRVRANVPAAITMIFGSFVAGSTPQGGGAVAFPVFTKLLGVSAADAKTFSLSIQAIGMGSASAVIAFTGRAVDRRALRLTVPAAIAGFLSGSFLFSFVSLPTAYLKVIFTLLVVTAGGSTWLSRRNAIIEQLPAAPLESAITRRLVLLVSVAGGVASALFGSGADVAVYLLLTIVLGVRPSIGVATSVVTMAAVSVVGFTLALLTGQLAPVTAPGAVDVFGMWLAAIPVVVIGAPIGSWFAHNASASTLARFIAGLAVVELLSTVIFLDDLRTDFALAGFATIGLLTTIAGIGKILALRDSVASARQPLSGSVRRLDVELGATR